MFNFIVGYDAEATVESSRMLEHTEDHVKTYLVGPAGLETSRLLNLPTLLMPEVGSSERQVARIGRIEHLTSTGSGYRFRFVPTPGAPEIPSSYIGNAASALNLGRLELSRTHWAVKEIDLHYALLGQMAPLSAPKVFAFPSNAREDDLVAVMMPFSPDFARVYTALKEAVTGLGLGLRCQRADDIWQEDALMDDIASLIWRARVVISDLSGKNPNVFYETGMAHTIGRDVIMLAQSADDVPFDLRHLRYVPYLANTEGVAKLKDQVATRLLTLLD